jgi:hypothetical protein
MDEFRDTSLTITESMEPLNVSVGIMDKAILPVAPETIVFLNVVLLENVDTAPSLINDTAPIVKETEPVVLPAIVNST